MSRIRDARAAVGPWWIPLLLGIALTWAAAALLQWHNQRLIRGQADALADAAEAGIQERFNRFEYGLRGTRGAVIAAGVDQVTRPQFEDYINSRETSREFPGALGFGFIRRIPVAREAEALARMRADGAPQFSIRTLTPHDGDRFVIQYIYPVQGNEKAVGLDIASEANRRAAALASARDGRPHLTEPITLVQADGKPRRGFLALLPVYAGHDALQTPAARERAVAGWSYAPLVVDDVLADLGPLMAQSAITLADLDGKEPFYRSPGADPAAAPGLRVVRDISVMGQQWQLALLPDARAVERLRLWPVAWVVVFGLALTSLVLWILHLWRTRLAIESGDDGLPRSDLHGLRMFLSSTAFARAWPPALFGLVLLLATVLWLLAQRQLDAVRPPLLQTASDSAEYFKRIEDNYRRDVRFLAATPAVAGLMRAVEDGSSPAPWTAQLADVFTAYMQANREVYQVRLIEAGPDWRESVKVVRSGERLDVADAAALQPRAGEPYIDGALQMGNGRVYVSEIGLNREFDTVERPHRPVWRFATPLFHADGRPFAIAIINVNAGQLLKTAADRALPGATLYITNPSGDFLWHPQPARAFGFELGYPHRWQDEFTPSGAWRGLDIDGLQRWRNPQGDMWGRQLDLARAGDGGPPLLRVAAIAPQYPVYQRIGLQALGVSALFLAVALLGTGLHYRLWWVTRRRQWDVRQQQLEMQRSKESSVFKALLELAPDASLIVDHDGVIRLANRQAEQMFGYPRARLEGMPVHALVPTRHAPAHEGHVRGFMADSRSRAMGEGRVFPARHADGSEFPVEVSLGTVPLEDRMLVYASVREVSSRMAIEAQLRAALQEAERANDAKSAFLANTSHEIRTPLNAIIGLTHLLAEEPLSEAQQRLAEKIQLSGRSLLGIVNDVLDLSKIEANEMALDPVPVDLRELLEEVGGVFAPQAEAKRLAFHLELDRQLPALAVTDPVRLRQVLVNLLGNALKFTETGRIALQAEVLPPAADAPSDRLNLRFTVTDTGIGIPEDVQARLFQPFTQADASTTRRFGGTGLGLSIVRRMVQLLGGAVGLESREGQGSRFYVELPLRIPQEGEIAAMAGRHASLFVLIADDDAADAARLQAMARALGWRSQTVADGAGLIQAVLSRRENGLRAPDALIVDWQMPVMDGLRAIRILAERIGRDQLPAVLMVSVHDSAYIAELDSTHLLGRILHKPVDSSALFNAVNEAVSRHTGDGSRVLQATRTEAVRARWLPGVRVLVVDDSQINLEVVSQLLERNGAVVETAESGYAALRCLQAADAYDAVLMDVQMPGIDGLETTRRIRDMPGLGALPVIALTAGALIEDRRRALAAGMDDFLSKPIEPSQLINRLRIAVASYRAKEIPVESVQAESGESDRWPAIAGLNAPQAKRLLLGDAELFLSTLDSLLAEHANLANAVADGVDAPGADDARRALAAQIHKLRSAAGTIGAERLHRLAAECEKALRTDTPAAAVLTQLSQALLELRLNSSTALAAWRAARVAAIEPSVDVPVDLTQLALSVRAIRTLLKEHNLGALDALAEQERALRTALGSEAYLRLEACLRQLDFARAYDMLSPLAAEHPTA